MEWSQVEPSYQDNIEIVLNSIFSYYTFIPTIEETRPRPRPRPKKVSSSSSGLSENINQNQNQNKQ